MAEQYTERPTEIEVFPLGSETDVILRKKHRRIGNNWRKRRRRHLLAVRGTPNSRARHREYRGYCSGF